MVIVVIVSDPASVLSMGGILVVFGSSAGVKRGRSAKIDCQQWQNVVEIGAPWTHK